MTISEILTSCQEKGLKLWVEDGKLKYRAPEGVLTPVLRSHLVEKKQELIEFLEELRQNEKTSLTPLRAFVKNDSAPLSYGQKRLWFLWKWNPFSSVYNITTALKLTGELNFEALEFSLEYLIERHKILKTIFREVDSEVTQIVKDELEIKIVRFDLSEENYFNSQKITSETANEKLEEIIEKEAGTPFDLTEGPLFRILLIKIDEKENILLFSMHHIISDGWSLGILIKEFCAVYESRVDGRSPALPEISIDYADYAIWQNDLFQEDRLAIEKEFWGKQLNGFDSVLELLTDYPRPLRQTFNGGKIFLKINNHLKTELSRLCQNEEVTLFVVLMTVYLVVLSKYSGQKDIIIGTPVAGRNQKDLENLIGFFVNTLLLRIEISESDTFTDLLKKVKRTFLDCLSHQEIPFEYLVDKFHKARDLSRPPLCQAVFAFGVSPKKTIPLRNLDVSLLEFDNETAKFDITLNLNETSESINGWFEYNADLFKPKTIEQFKRHFYSCLEKVIGQPHLLLKNLSLLQEEEQAAMIHRWKMESSQTQNAKCLHELFSLQAQTQPDAIALVCDDTELTYREVEERSDRLAYKLIEMGIKPEELIVVTTTRTPAFIIGILGILKAGGAYVPLDPAYPSERLNYILNDINARIVLSDSALSEKVSLENYQVIDLENLSEELDFDTNAQISVVSSVEQLAYVIYTSGSTGLPKGVGISHSNVTRLFDSTENLFNFNDRDVWTLFHSGAFDFSVWEIWGALLYGGKLVIVPYLVSRSPSDFYDLLRKTEVTVLNQTPSAFYQLSNAAVNSENKLTKLRYVVFGGESLDFRRLQTWLSDYSTEKISLVNMYGITETTVHVTFYQLTDEDIIAEPNSIIGCPLSDLNLFLLDEGLNPVAAGMPGEIYVTGSGLARGYVNNPALTAQKFIPNPFSEVPGARLYRSGDLAYFTSENKLKYLGRADHQVKIRGFRIELGEIESTLMQSGLLKEAAVLAFEDEGEKSLVAYAVADDSDSVSAQSLRNILKQKLPEYMIPAHFVFLQQLPLTNNNKLDRQKLPSPLSSPQEDRSDFVPASTPTQLKLVEIWSEVLKVKAGINDNFFDLGGDSIKSLQVIAKMRKEGFEVELPNIFEKPTIAELAELTDNRNFVPVISGERMEISPFSQISDEDKEKLPSDVEDAYPLTMLQTGMLFHSVYKENITPYQNTSSMHLRGNFDEKAIYSAINQIIDKHPVLRTSFNLTDYSVPLQLVYRTVEPSIKIENIAHLSDEEQESYISEWMIEESKNRFDWQIPSLIRFVIHLRSSNSFQFSWTEHHAILDGWSVAVMVAELFNRYTQICEKNVSIEDKSASSFAEIVALEKITLEDPQANLFWKNYLEDYVFNGIPSADFLSDDRLPDEEEKYIVQISPEIVERLKAVASELGVPIKSVFQAAHLRVIGWICGTNDVLTGVVTHGRLTKEGAENVLGLCLNSLPVRVDLKKESWGDLIARVFQMEREMLPYRRYPLPALQKLVSKTDPLFETLFNYLHFHVYDEIKKNTGIELVEGKSLGRTNMKLAATFWQDISGSLKLDLAYLPQFFTRKYIHKIGEFYVSALKDIAYFKDRIYLYESLLSPQEKNEILKSSDKSSSYPEAPLLQHAFERICQEFPLKTAVISEFGELTFDELNKLSNQLAHKLRELGVKPETTVGVLLSQSVELIISLLGILKAGGTFVPIDPATPPERLQFQVADSDIQILIFSNEKSTIQSDQNIQSLEVSVKDWEYENYSNLNPLNLSEKRNLAYIIYTSGSTGTPKGVAVENQAASVHFLTAGQKYELGEGDKVLQFASPSFDVSLEQILAPLLKGASVVVRSEEMSNPEKLNEKIKEYGLTVINLPPQFFNLWLESLSFENLKTLRLVIVGGDTLSIEILKKWIDSTDSKIKLFNAYGPTETIVTATIWQPDFDEITSGQKTKVLIGAPLNERTPYILDEAGQLVPFGVPGELYLSEPLIARGYINRSDLTAASFVPNPFSENGGERMYKTGDIARLWSDGQIEFFGRKDQQVKIRGFRIELNEIEAALQKHSDIKEAAITLNTDSRGEKVLVGYVVPKRPNSLTAELLRNFLEKKIPHFMIPQYFVLMEHFPLTISGKIDLKALPAPAFEPLDDVAAENETLTSTEELLIHNWKKALGVQRIRKTDNFFLLGGDSLSATRVMSGIKKVFQVELPLSKIFENPTLQDLSRIIDQTEKSKDGVELPSIKALAKDAVVKLSFSQERMWFLQQMNPKSTMYILPIVFSIKGKLNISALHQSLDELVKRHELLRAGFIEKDGIPFQKILSFEDSRRFIALETIKPENAENALETVKDSVLRSFDLLNDFPFRPSLFMIGENHFVLSLTMHHIIADGWSVGILLKEFADLYRSMVLDSFQVMPPLDVQYTDYAIAQKEWFDNGLLDKQLNYWKSVLTNEEYAVTIRPSKRFSGFRALKSRSYSACLPPDLFARLNELCQRENVTIFMLLMTVWQILLSFYSAQKTVRVGTPVANRRQADLEAIVGVFVNTIVIQTEISPEFTFADQLAEVRQICLAAYANQDIPFEKLVEELNITRDINQHPIFQIFYSHEMKGRIDIELPDLEVQPMSTAESDVKFDISLNSAQRDDGLWLFLQFNESLFEAEMMKRLLSHFQNLLQEVAENPTLKIKNLSYLSQTELSDLQELSKGKQSLVDIQTLHQWFELKSASAFEKELLIFEDKSHSYGEINSKANQLARELIKFGVKEEQLVGLLMERSVDFVISLLAILKVGGAYVPIDPNSPAKRLNTLLQEGKIKWLITNNKEISPDVNAESLQVINIAELDTTQNSKENLNKAVDPSGIAYVIYTSGSTGSPKGVLISHSAICNHMSWMQQSFPVFESDKILQKTPFIFDASVWEFWLPLLNGARLVLAKHEDAHNVYQIIKNIIEHQISIIQVVPSLLALLIDEADFARCKSLRRIFCGGEVLTKTLIDKLKKRLPEVEVINLYGPTEATIDATFWINDSDEVPETIPIGEPIFNTQAWILNENLQIVPSGVPGELHLGGDGLARGYVNDPLKTAEKFIPNPFGIKAGDRLYKTGDKVIRNEKGLIQFQGRIDNQIKLRGYRIEPGEIEKVLLHYDGISDAVVRVITAENKEDILVAYIIQNSSANSEFNENSLRNFLSENLPLYMIPNRFVMMENFPKTPSGKIDVKRLVDSNLPVQEIKKDAVFPRNKIELQLKNIWEEILQIDQIDVQSNFFTLGGTSLSGLRLISKIRHYFGENVPLSFIFQNQTIESMALKLNKEAEVSASNLVSLNKGEDQNPFYLIHPVGGSVFCYFSLAYELKSHFSIYGLESKKDFDSDSDLAELAELYSDEIKNLTSDNFLLGGWSLGGVIAFEMARQLSEKGKKVLPLILIDSYLPNENSKQHFDEKSIKKQFLIDAAATLSIEILPNEITSFNEDEFFESLYVRALEKGSLSRDISREDIWQRYEIFKNNVRALYSYKPAQYDGEVLLLRPHSTAFDEKTKISDEKWKSLTGGKLEIQYVGENHYSILSKKHAGELAAVIETYLKKKSVL